ncbi:MAG TPA: hypothetical protein VKL19_14400 [Thermoanaerobaculia bacterium]|nr:hypothetical protein [Thermoanaerobaculia bacterium]
MAASDSFARERPRKIEHQLLDAPLGAESFQICALDLPGPVKEGLPLLVGSELFISTSGGIRPGSRRSVGTFCQSTEIRLRIACV